jgi:hypothetical protein
MKISQLPKTLTLVSFGVTTKIGHFSSMYNQAKDITATIEIVVHT